MSTTIATGPSIHLSRRVLLSVAVAAALAIGGGAAAVSLTSSDGSTSRPASRPAHPAPAAVTNVDIPTLWSQLTALPTSEQTNIVASLTPGVRAQLHAETESVTASNGSASGPADPAPAVVTNVDIPTLWSQLGALPASEQTNIVASLSPGVRAQLQAETETIAAIFEAN